VEVGLAWITKWDSTNYINTGVAGAGVIRALSKKLDKSKHELVLINSRPFDIWLPGLVRAVVTDEVDLDVIDKGVFTSYG
jgi:hypothetical protein